MLGNAADEILGDGDEVLEVCVGVVELADGELWVVGLVDALVAERRAELKHAVYTSNDETLEPQLRGNAESDIFAHCFSMHGEWPGHGTASIAREDRSLKLKEVALMKEVSEIASDVGPQTKGIYGSTVGQHVNMTMQGIFNLLRPGHQARRQNFRKLGGLDGELACLGSRGLARDSYSMATQQASACMATLSTQDGYTQFTKMGRTNDITPVQQPG